MRLARFACLSSLLVGLVAPRNAASDIRTSVHDGPGPRFTRVHALRYSEGVFAYARISPDGRYLAYASELKGREVTVVDLSTGYTVFTESGIDAYWSLDGERMIYSGQGGVSIRHQSTGAITRRVAPTQLGDYYSWARRDGKDLILTIDSYFYYLNGDKAVLPAGRVPSCPNVGMGERPLISKDGMRITTFVRGTIVVRNLTDCNDMFDTGIPGAKADFSWDGRYIAFHAPKAGGAGYDVQVVDVKERTIRTITNMVGSSYYPSWTKDGRLCFRYDGPEYKGFMMANNVLDAKATKLTELSEKLPERRAWSDIFPETKRATTRYALVMVWGAWSAHSPIALGYLQNARDTFREKKTDISVMTATDPGSSPGDVTRIILSNRISLQQIPLAPSRIRLSEINNQSPAFLLFRDGVLVDRKLGTQSREKLVEWVTTVMKPGTRQSNQLKGQP